MSKYALDDLMRWAKHAAEFRNQLRSEGATDNVGAIHSAERIIGILSNRIKYNRKAHLDKNDPNAEISEAAFVARRDGETPEIEHVFPQRVYTEAFIELVAKGATDEELVAFIRENYRLVLLTKDERRRLDKGNRTTNTEDRLAKAGVKLHKP
jgi:hypothetical protein